jgi:glutaredoxin
MLDKLGVIYDQVDLRLHPDMVEKFKELGHLTAPIVTVSDNQIWSGFKYELIKALAKRKENH